MNISIINRRNNIRKLREERDQLFSIIDEVTYDEQVILLNSIIDITKSIDHDKEVIKEVLQRENN